MIGIAGISTMLIGAVPAPALATPEASVSGASAIESPAPTVEGDVVNLADGIGIRLAGTSFLDTGELTVELHDDPLTAEEASSLQPLDPDPIILGTVTPDRDGRFAFEAPFDPPAGSVRFVVRDAEGTVFFFQNAIFAEGIDDETEPAPQPDEDAGPRLADTGGPSSPAEAAAAALAMIVAGGALAGGGRRRRGIRST